MRSDLVDYKKEKERAKLGGKPWKMGEELERTGWGVDLTKHNVYSCEILK